MKQKKRIYMDFAASTPLDPRAKRAMDRFWDKDFGNPGGIHTEGVIARKAVEKARATVAGALHARPDEIIFTGSGTESNTIAIMGVIKQWERLHDWSVKGLHIITTTIEHPSVLEGFKELESRGVEVDYLGVDSRGILDLAQARAVIRRDTALVSVMLVNNEIGTIQPVREVAKIIQMVKSAGAAQVGKVHAAPFFHTDASQALLWLQVNVESFGVDLLTIDGQKIYGPKGIGALYIRRGVLLDPLMQSGSQEKGLRPGTEPVPFIVGLGEALAVAEQERARYAARVVKLRDYFIKKVLREVPGANLNGDPVERLPNNVNISVPGFDNEFLIISLDARGIACASRSACIVGEGGSYVVRAMGKSPQEAQSSLRFSLGRSTKKEDVDYVVKSLKEIVLQNIEK